MGIVAEFGNVRDFCLRSSRVIAAAASSTHMRRLYQDRIDEVQQAKNRTKLVRSKVEHVFQILKLKFGFVSYRGLRKNANRLFTTCALVNLFTVRKRLLC